MSGAVANGIAAAADLDLAGVWKRGEALDPIVAHSDVLIDFSLPGANDEIVHTGFVPMCHYLLVVACGKR